MKNRKDEEHLHPMNEKMQDKYKHNRKDKLVVFTTFVLVVSLAVAAWVKPADVFSDSERRYLDQVPEITVESVMSGAFVENFEEYTIDQFPLRDGWRQLKSIAALYGFRQEDVHDIYSYDGYLSKMEYPMNPDSLNRAANVFRGIYDRYLKNADTNVYFSIIPDKNCFMAKESGHLSIDYEALYEYMKAYTGYMEYIDIVSLLELEDYYKTDTHWRQEKIVDVAHALLSGMNSLEYEKKENDWENYEKKELDSPFYGVYVGQSGLPVDGETLYYLDSSILRSCKVFDYENNKEIDVYDMEKAKGKDPYELFLSGPLSLVTIENPDASSDKELILFRDSFGSSVAPLMAEQYAKITLVDIRYMSSALLGNWITFENQDVLFLYSTQVLNNSETMK